MSEAEAWRAFGEERARWPLEALRDELINAQSGADSVSVRGTGMEAFSYLIKQLIDSTPLLNDRPLIVITPTEEEALRLGHNLRACLSGGGPLIGEARRSVYIWDEPSSPFENLRPSARAQGERLALLAMIIQGRAASVQVMSTLTFARRVIPSSHLQERTYRLVVGEELDREAMIESLAAEGYERVSLVVEPCTFLARGDQLDLFSPHLSAPIRVSFFGDEVESICTFKPETQRRDSASFPEVTIPALREAPLTTHYAAQCGDGVISLADDLFEADSTLSECGIHPSAPAIQKLADDLTDGIVAPDLESLLPCFFPEGLEPLSEVISEHIGDPWFAIWDRSRALEILEQRAQSWERTHERGLREGRLSAPPLMHLLRPDEVNELWSRGMCLAMTPHELDDQSHSLYLPSHLPLRQRLEATRRSEDPLLPLVEALEVWVESGKRIGVVCQTFSQRDRLIRRFSTLAQVFTHSLAEWLRQCQSSALHTEVDTSLSTEVGKESTGREVLAPGLYLIRGTLSAGFHDSAHQVTLISAAEIFNTPLSTRRQTKAQRGVDPLLDRLLSGGSFTPRSAQPALHIGQGSSGASVIPPSLRPSKSESDATPDATRDDLDPWDNDSVESLELYGDREGEGHEEVDSPFINSLRDLNIDDPIVHLDYGIGIFRGLVQIDDQGTVIDFAQLEFAKKEVVLLPVYRLHLIQKFIGSRTPKLSTKGGADWRRSLSEAQTSAEDQARELLEAYATRARTTGFKYSSPDDRYAEFEARFPYTETRDQLRSIRKIVKEMCAPQPMDHLLCGDVGFGKTEVAMRAAMKAVLDGRQVAVLVPTTILAAQHAKSFADRFAYTPYVVAQLSRFITPDQRREVKDRLRRGEINIVVGTHGLLHKSVEVPQLGLLILDEEHRFGVKDKERLKKLRAQLDVLSMTATPIPRTLHMSLSGLRSMSVIATPPRDRLSVYTRMVRVSETIVREAATYELRRGGQIFFVHNRVETIETRRRWLQSILPELSIGVAHGKMKPSELEEVMWGFTEGAFNVLLCTTLIENGIDIPRANTIMIDDADHFGLAQLYQLRGRVGRSHERGRCFLLISPEAILSDEARARLNVIQKFTELGSGFHIASQDLELRGAGELLGTRQKGHAQKVGLDLYNKLLDQAMRDLQDRPQPQMFDPVITLRKRPQGAIPSDYIDDVQERLRVYRRVAHFNRQEQIPLLFEELLDRFGRPPQEMINYLTLQRITILAKSIGLHEVCIEGGRLLITLHPETPASPRIINAAIKREGSPLVRVSEDQVCVPLNSEQKRAPERIAVEALLHIYDLLPQPEVL